MQEAIDLAKAFAFCGSFGSNLDIFPNKWFPDGILLKTGGT